MTNDAAETPPTLTNLKEALASTLLIGGQDPAILARQAEILDRLFTTILDQKVAERFNSRYPQDVQAWLHFALRIQKQCTDTMKSRTAMEYMNGLTTLKSFTQAPPHALENQKRTIKDIE